MVGKRFVLWAAVSTAVSVASTGAAQASGYTIIARSNTRAGTIYDNGGGQCTYNNSSVGGRCSGGGSTPTSFSGTVSPIGGDGSARIVTVSSSGTGGGATAKGSVTADLTTASLHLYAADSDRTGNCSAATVPCGYAEASGTLNDTLHFTVAGATATSITTIQARFTLEGSLMHTGSTVDTPDSGYAEIYGALNFGGTPSRFDLISDSTSGYATKVNYLDNYPSGISPSTWTTNGAHTSNVSNFTFTLDGANGDANFSLDASLLCDRGYTCDFANTAKFALILPAGVSFTSDSGVFLTGNAVGGVPEPASWSMLIAGFGVVGSVTRRRRATLTV